MKRIIIIACLVGSLILFLDSINIVHALVMFLLAGIIPGTNIALSPIEMIVLMMILIGLATVRFVVTPIIQMQKTHKA